MGKNILFFLAGWFSVAIGFEVAPMYGNIAGVVSFLLLVLWFSHKESHLTKRALDLPHGGLLCEVVVDEEGGTKIYPIESANQ